MKKRYVIIGALILFVIMPLLFLINIEVLKAYLVFLIFLALYIIISFFIIDIQAKPPISTVLKYEIVEEKYKDRKVFIMKSKQNDKRSNKYIFYLHGGAYVLEATYKHWQFLEDIVDETGMTLILPDYPLAPKNTYKDVFDMIIPLYKEIISRVEKENIILMGDSAGGGMGLGLLQKIGEENGHMPYKTILLSPWLDVSMKNPKIDEIEKVDPVLLKEGLKASGKAYAGEDGMENYLVNPILGPVDKLKNITIYTGTYDMLNPDVHLFIEKAKSAGISIDLREIEKAIHIWMTHVDNKNVYAAMDTFKDIVNLLNEEDKNEI